MRVGFSGPDTAVIGPGVTVGTILANAQMAATDRLLEVAASLYAYDSVAGAPQLVRTAKSIAAANGGADSSSVLPILSNGASYDPQQNNTPATLLASAVRSTNTQTSNQTNYNGRGCLLLLDVTGNPGGAETLTLRVLAKNPIGTLDRIMVSFPATVAAVNDCYAYWVYPGAVETIATAGQEVQGLPLPRIWYATVIHSGAGNWTYSLSAVTLV